MSTNVPITLQIETLKTLTEREPSRELEVQVVKNLEAVFAFLDTYNASLLHVIDEMEASVLALETHLPSLSDKDAEIASQEIERKKVVASMMRMAMVQVHSSDIEQASTAEDDKTVYRNVHKIVVHISNQLQALRLNPNVHHHFKEIMFGESVSRNVLQQPQESRPYTQPPHLPTRGETAQQYLYQ